MIVLTLLNTFLPAIAVTVATWLALRLLRVNAATRYLAWWAVLASLIAMLLWPEGERRVEAVASVPQVTIEPRVDWLLWAVAVWALYALYRLTRIAVSYVHLRALVRRAAPIDSPAFDQLRTGVSRPVRLLASPSIQSPMAVGYLRTAILLPAGLTDRLAPSEVEHVLLHELAHVARYDDWTKLLSRLINAALGLHPVAAFALSQIERERELACDDWVVAASGDARSYAASLAHIFELSRG